ncbi:hypothetical protein LOTGIDRAFT_234972 [Lottia gigantea]|uniref:Cadherin-like beta-sandwich-like domain-containing protein n=1 Tax=Lottia gigantea TaxID=225164 RepID=V3Z9U8_LOTGI|nr:hypothetical protein LOTGIDRAFT_234972 [Lottia gigantea]ESO87738.1 hypothetical protein LOTGIDRAFT_234972 [Lottia gigantea]
MDDCNLDKLSLKPGKLDKKFDKNVTEYNTVLTSEIEKVAIDALTSDSGASYRVLGGDEKKQVTLPEGCVTDIKVEVTAEDGKTMKFYVIHAKRLSAQDASLSSLKLDRGILLPEFSSDNLSYSVLLACNVSVLNITTTVPDIKSTITINNEKPDIPVPLNIGLTIINIEITSVDGSNKQTYTLEVARKQVPRFVKLSDPKEALTYECPISLNPFYQPITIKDSDPKRTFTGPLINELTKISKYDPINGRPLPPEWRIQDYNVDKKLSSVNVVIPCIDGSFSESVKFTEIGGLLEKCNISPKVENLQDKFKATTVTLNHTIQSRKWEKNLQQIYHENDVNELVKTGKEELEKYFDALPKPGLYRQFEEGESPLDYLETAIQNYATAVKNKPKDPSLHLQLGLLLEEKYYVEDMHGLKAETYDALPTANTEAKEGSKLEEALAICQLRGVDSTAPVSLKLKAIDEEYHHLLDSGQSHRADQVMGIYAWFSKKMSQEGMAAQKVTDEESPLGQAYLKYLDALSLDETKSLYNFHVGRLLVLQGDYKEAIKRLEVTINWNPQHQMARFYLGLALALQHGGPGSRSNEAISYLSEAMETLLTENSKLAMTDDEPILRRELLCENLLRSNNVILLRGIIQLGQLLLSNQNTSTISAEHVFYTASLLASQVLPTLSRGDLYKQIEWILLDSHSNLLELYTKSPNATETLIVLHCERLSGLIFHCTIPQNGPLQELQENTCQKLVKIQPCNSHALYLLGTAQMARYENSSAGEAADRLLANAKSSFKASIALEGQPKSGDVPELVKEQGWWQKKLKEEEERKKAEEAKKASEKKPGPATRGGATGRGALAARGRGAPTAPRGGAAARGGTTPARGGATTRGGAAVARGGATKPAAGAKSASPATKTNVKPAGSKGHVCEAKPSATDSKAKASSPSTPQTPATDNKPAASGPKNTPSYLPRLGLGRAFKASNETEEAKKYYEEVIAMAPEVHDAYIESAEMLTKTEPMAAVDIFSKFPVPENPSFDDAYIFGEIVRLLMKNEKYDDPRLTTNLIAYGRVLGLAALEKNVKILEEKFKSEILKNVYAGVNHKSVDDPDMQQFFKFKLWI